MKFAIDFHWFPRAELQKPDSFATLLRKWLDDLATLDERLRYLGRKGREGEIGAGLPLEVLVRMIVRGQGIMSLSSAWGPLDPSLQLSAGAGHVAGALPGRVYLTLQAPMARESKLLRECLASGIRRFDPDRATIWTPNSPAEQAGATVWELWRPAADTPPPVPHFQPHGQPASTEPWLGGILQTWPQNEPAKLASGLE